MEQFRADYSIAVDSIGNVYTTGYRNLSGSTINDIYVSKHDANGTLLWLQTKGGIAQDEGRSIALDDNGNVYVGGSFNSTVVFTSSPSIVALVSAGHEDAFIAKFDGNGVVKWAKRNFI